MAHAGVERRLTAILAADVVGYSRLMAADESGTHARLKELRTQFLEATIAEHRGRIVKLMGDGVLVEFASVVDAVHCAVTIQRGMAERVADAPEHQRIEFRIGVNLGDVIIEDDDIYGDGVNIAARLEGLAEPGGICLSDAAYQQVKGKTELLFQDLGEKELKNIPESVRVHRVNLDPSRMTPGAYEAALRAECLAPPDKPSIAVLPFENMSGDPEQEFFADGMSEDIITGLSRFSSLYVIAHSSTFAYKGKSPDVREIARDLGVRYILRGSIRRGGNRIRITGQLVDAETGKHLWAERYDRNLDGIFLVQDEVTDAIVSTIAPEIDDLERRRAQKKPPDSLNAWIVYQHGLAAYHDTTKDSLEFAINQFDKVNELDPGFALAFALAADARVRYLFDVHLVPDAASFLSQAQEKAGLGIRLDTRDPTCLWADSRVQSILGHHDIAITRAEEAVSLNSSSAMAHYALGFALGRAGHPGEALTHIDRAIRLSPRDVFIAGFLAFGSKMLFDTGCYQEAMKRARRASQYPNPRSVSFCIIVAALNRLGKKGEIPAALTNLLTHTPMNSLSYVRDRLGWNFPASSEANEQIIAALREAGLPE